MPMNRNLFFDSIKPIFGNVFTQEQVKGITAILDEWELRWMVKTPPAQFAYVLATPWWETGRRMVPIEERGSTAYFMHMYDKTGARPKIAAVLGNTQIGDGAKFHGMGLTQVTGRGNARKATKIMRELGYINEVIDFEENPQLLLKSEYAVPILFISMEEGWYTGRSLDKEIDVSEVPGEFAEFVRARLIINGQDHAQEIAKAAQSFLNAINKGMR